MWLLKVTATHQMEQIEKNDISNTRMNFIEIKKRLIENIIFHKYKVMNEVF